MCRLIGSDRRHEVRLLIPRRKKWQGKKRIQWRQISDDRETKAAGMKVAL